MVKSAVSLIGHLGGREFEVGDAKLSILDRPWPRDIPAYACISLVALDSKPLATSKQILLAASARTENTAMPWNEDRTGFTSNDWGDSPTLSEAVPLDLTLPGPPVQAWRVTPAGQKAAQLPTNRNSFQLRPHHKTLWVLLTRP